MATEKQYEFFQRLYDEESDRATILAGHAKSNLSLVTFYSAFVLFLLKEQPTVQTLETALVATALTSIVAAFLASLWATNISTYESTTTPAEIVESFGDRPPGDAEFLDDRLVDIAVAYERNSKVNDRKAMQLTVARYLLLIGIALHVTFVVRVLL